MDISCWRQRAGGCGYDHQSGTEGACGDEAVRGLHGTEVSVRKGSFSGLQHWEELVQDTRSLSVTTHNCM